MNTEEIDMGALEHIADNVFLEDKRPIILFDGICNMCNSAVNYALDYDSIGKSKKNKTNKCIFICKIIIIIWYN